ncbi:MAG: glycerate kinase [Erysipelotrichaceae bacterium]|nr:glycerate kinase [Erysipelotrichaceae bacterium]
MKRVIIIPDSFKGTLSSAEVIEIISDCLRQRYPDWQITGIPVADGGEGTVDAMVQAMDGHYEETEVFGPYFEKMPVRYGSLGKTAVVEVASCSGLPLVKDRKNPALTTSYGVGEQILDALKKGYEKIVVGLGGSCCNDAGCGMAAALGVEFLDKEGKGFVPVGATLMDIEHIDVSQVLHFELEAMCDVHNPLYGPDGAAYIFSPQKGADRKMVEELDKGLRHFAEVVRNDLGIDPDVPGGGAAGGIGAGIYALLGGKLKMGIDVVLDTVGFDEKLSGTDLVITGEGRFDSQSLQGKVLSGIASRCLKAGVECVAVVGCRSDEDIPFEEMGISRIIPTSDGKKPVERQQAIDNLIRTVNSTEF